MKIKKPILKPEVLPEVGEIFKKIFIFKIFEKILNSKMKYKILVLQDGAVALYGTQEEMQNRVKLLQNGVIH
ncbi:MAG: hypothetical protein ACEY3E_07735, partial [Candidatus Tisiphia sp.]